MSTTDTTTNNTNGKGSRRRPSAVPYQVYMNNWERIFRKDNTECSQKPELRISKICGGNWRQQCT